MSKSLQIILGVCLIVITGIVSYKLLKTDNIIYSSTPIKESIISENTGDIVSTGEIHGITGNNIFNNTGLEDNKTSKKNSTQNKEIVVSKEVDNNKTQQPSKDCIYWKNQSNTLQRIYNLLVNQENKELADAENLRYKVISGGATEEMINNMIAEQKRLVIAKYSAKINQASIDRDNSSFKIKIYCN